MRLFVLLIPILLTACINDRNLKSVFPYHSFNGNSAKVWVLNDSDDEDAVTASQAYRSCFIFYSNKSFKRQSLIHLGSNQGEIGSYSLTENENGEYILNLTYADKAHTHIKYRVLEIDNLQLKLKQLDGDQFIYTFNSLTPPI